jgi:hypothetical protein
MNSYCMLNTILIVVEKILCKKVFQKMGIWNKDKKYNGNKDRKEISLIHHN